MNEIRLIDANALKKIFQDRHDFYVTSWGGFSNMPFSEKSRIDELNACIAEIVNSPTVEQKEFEQILQPIKVNIPEDIKERLIEELSKPRKVILDESKTVTDCIIAYGDGFESARRLFERPHGEWIKWNFKTFGAMGDWEYKCSNCEKVYGGEHNYCPNCGADMRKGEGL